MGERGGVGESRRRRSKDDMLTGLSHASPRLPPTPHLTGSVCRTFTLSFHNPYLPTNLAFITLHPRLRSSYLPSSSHACLLDSHHVSLLDLVALLVS
jgi:hypothetical protein